ncbi:hypothetical protein BDR26DRAFT_858332 [Obelidium mucronatum]|nr:hypothetical protein BDR26DRAFT_858332 [Obelidium mucronatum]
MIKVFRLPIDSEILFQNALIEREILELMEARKKKVTLEDKAAEETLEKGTVRQRAIEEGDICPICMEDLDPRTGAITYCKLSCGNNLHVKCMKVLMDHQTKNMGLENIKCPLCRKDFGKYEDLKKEFTEGFHQHIKLENQSRHYGTVCSECNDDANLWEMPQVNLLKKKKKDKQQIYVKISQTRCSTCKDFGVTSYLCDKCFCAGCHSQHDQFRHRTTRSSKWIQSKREIRPPLPDNQINDIQSRELTSDDYEILLSLGEDAAPPPATSGPEGYTPLHIISGYPTRTLSYGDPLLSQILSPSNTGGGNDSSSSLTGFLREPTTKPKCDVCLSSFSVGEIVRQIPCRHTFHQHCVDRWLLMQKSTCPCCCVSVFWEAGKEGCEIDMTGRNLVEEKRFIGAKFKPTSIGVGGGVNKRKDKAKPGSKEKGKCCEDGSAKLSRESSMMVIVGSSSNGRVPRESPRNSPLRSAGGFTSRRKKTGTPKPKKLPPLFTNERNKFQAGGSISTLIVESTIQSTHLTPRVSTSKAQLEAASSRLSLFSTSANSIDTIMTCVEPPLFDDLIISRPLNKSRSALATAAESETLSSKSNTQKLSKPPANMSAVTTSGPSGFKTSLQKRKFLPNTSLGAIEKPPINLDSLVECHKYKLQQVRRDVSSLQLNESESSIETGEVSLLGGGGVPEIGASMTLHSRTGMGSKRIILPQISFNGSTGTGFG